MNKEERREYSKRHYLKNREKYRKRSLEHYHKNKEKRKEYAREYHKQYKKRDYVKEKQRVYMREYRKRPEYQEKQKIRMFAVNKLKMKDGGKCSSCDAVDNLEYHHIKYTNNKEDIILLCKECHTKLHYS